VRRSGRRHLRALRLAGVLVALLAVGGCSRRETVERAPTASLPPGTPVVLVSIDTLRSDRLPAYGYDQVATPALDALARESILFERAYSPVPLTLPAHASLLTGLTPPRHGVRDNAGYRLDAVAHAYLPSLLRRRGYRTGAAVSSWVLRGTAGLEEGFDLYDDRLEIAPRALLSAVQRSGDETLVAATKWLEGAADEPFFLFFHIYEPHTPHEPPAPFRDYPSPYDGEVAAADAIVGGLLDSLKQLDVYRRALIVLVSDHGEGLDDHGDYEHGLLLYREALQVPLLVKLPDSQRGGSRVKEAASLVDVMPTILDLLGIEVPGGLDGRALLGNEEAAAPPVYAETAFPRLHFGWSELYSLIDYPYHFIYGPDPELYDLESDPDERDNLVASERVRASRLREHLDTIDREIGDPSDEDAETRQKLAALGYIGTARGGSSDGPRPDPKSQIHLLERLRGAFTHYENRRFPEAERAFRALLEESPNLVDAWEQLGHSLTAQERFEESLVPFERAMELSGGAPQVAGAIAAVLLRLDRLDEARRYAELAADRHELSRDTLAQIAVRQGDLAQAEALVDRALAGRGTRLGPLISQAELRLAQNRLEEVLTITAAVVDEAAGRGSTEELRGVHYLRGSALARLGRLDEAAAAYGREIELFPADVEAYGRLALVSLLLGRPEAASATLRTLLERIPTPAANAEAVRTLRRGGSEDAAGELLRAALSRWPDDDELRSLSSAG
jgi:arylsulfatase A-like enzyme/Flp pilus assembly protein TadD